ncbi:MAG: lipase family alpha/beta hydrolase [Aeromicrobium sp.]
MGRLFRTALLLACLLAIGPVLAADAADYAPLDQLGPALSPTQAELDASLFCSPSVTGATVNPVLLSPGTGATAPETFAWGWEPAFDQLGIPWCEVRLPNHTLGPIDVNGEYLVNAIRTVHQLSGRKVDILGWSQGGMSMRWSLRFWPDTRQLVDDVVGFAPSNHGTTQFSTAMCAQVGCRPAVYQQASDSEFIKALNSRTETFGGISYTNIYSAQDLVVEPAMPGNCSSCLSIGDGMIANIQTQEVCPQDLSNHVTIGAAPITYHLVVDAITHDGPADASRIAASACTELVMPGVTDPAALAGGLAALQAAAGTLALIPGPLPNPIAGIDPVNQEPALPCYVFASCGAGATTQPTTPSAPSPSADPVVAVRHHDDSDSDSDSGSDSDSDRDSDSGRRTHRTGAHRDGSLANTGSPLSLSGVMLAFALTAGGTNVLAWSRLQIRR